MENERAEHVRAIKRAIASKGELSAERINAWKGTGDGEVLGALYEYLRERWQYGAPQREAHLAIEVLLCIMRGGFQPDLQTEFTMNAYDAGRCLLGLAIELDARADADGTAAVALTMLRDRLASEYRSSDESMRRRIVHGFLEHAFETQSLRKVFDGWKDTDELAAAHAEASRWANP